MKKRLASAAVLLAAFGCLYASTPAAAQSAAPDKILTANTVPNYPISRVTFAEALAQYRVGAGHRAMYANITGNQMWSLAQSKFGEPDAQSAIYEARQLCEAHAVPNRLDPGQCVPVAVDDWQVYDPGPLFSITEQLQAQQRSVTIIDTQHQE